MPSDLAFRLFAPTDLAAVRALHDRAFRVLAAGHHTPAQLTAHARLIATPGYAEDLRQSHLMLALAGDRLVASAGWLAVAAEPGTARIRKVFVDPDRARQGLATRLVRDAEARARAAGYDRIIVRANINAVALYERLGYRPLAPGSMALPGGNSVPVLYMALAPAEK